MHKNRWRKSLSAHNHQKTNGAIVSKLKDNIIHRCACTIVTFSENVILELLYERNCMALLKAQTLRK